MNDHWVAAIPVALPPLHSACPPLLRHQPENRTPHPVRVVRVVKVMVKVRMVMVMVRMAKVRRVVVMRTAHLH